MLNGIKVLFLDIDGVLNDEKMYIQRRHIRNTLKHKGLKYTRESKSEDISSELIERLNTVVRKTGCFIVISSCWRNIYSIQELQQLFTEAGFKYSDKIIDKTINSHHEYTYKNPWYENYKLTRKIHWYLTWKLKVLKYIPRYIRDPRFSRGHEIQVWLDNHPEVYRFAIVDDDCDMAHLKDKLIRTDYRHGLTFEDMIKLINRLGVR